MKNIIFLASIILTVSWIANSDNQIEAAPAVSKTVERLKAAEQANKKTHIQSASINTSSSRVQ